MEKYLIILGVICVIIGIVLCIYLIISRKKNKIYMKAIDDDTVIMNIVKETEEFNSSMLIKSATTDMTKKIKYGATAELDENSSQLETELMNQSEALKTEPLDYSSEIATEYEKTELMEDDILQYTNFIETYKYDEKTIKNREKSECRRIEEEVFEGKYLIEDEIHGGGMSNLFLARNAKLGNKWVIKYIDYEVAKLANEEDILKMINHINLPKIADIFDDKNGIYIVENFIDGVSLNNVLMTGKRLSQAMVIDFAEQFAQVLSYLHNFKPMPIIHCDLKPSNIMITHDNKIVLIDFGISKIQGVSSNNTVAATYRYAAPEQLTKKAPVKYQKLVDLRFGDKAPDDIFGMGADNRSDIYSFGVIMFEILTGQIPTVKNIDLIKNHASESLSKIILKCLKIKPEERYQNIDDIKNDLQKLKAEKFTMMRSIIGRRIVFVCTIAAYILSATFFASASYLINLENGATISVDPDLITVSLQQSTEITLEKIFEDGTVKELMPEDFKWTSTSNDVAQVDGVRIVGINPGETELTGVYKNKEIKIKVNVIEPVDDTVSVSLKYKEGRKTEKFAGNGNLNHTDGNIDKAEFVSPGSIAMLENGDLYISDSGCLRHLYNGKIETPEMKPEYINGNILKSYKNDLYTLSDIYENDEGKLVYGLYKIDGNEYKEVYLTDALDTNISDFTFDDKYIYMIEANNIVEEAVIKQYNIENGEINVLCSVDFGINSICKDNNFLYMTNIVTGSILKYDIEKGTIENFAGTSDSKGFIDSAAPQFYQPSNIAVKDGNIYLTDFNVIRTIKVDDENNIDSETIMGTPGVFYDEKIVDDDSDEIKLNYSPKISFCFDGNNVLVTDPVMGVIRKGSI